MVSSFCFTFSVSQKRHHKTLCTVCDSHIPFLVYFFVNYLKTVMYNGITNKVDFLFLIDSIQFLVSFAKTGKHDVINVLNFLSPLIDFKIEWLVEGYL